MRYQAVIISIWNPKIQSKEYIVDELDSKGNGNEVYRSCYLDECESFCVEHDYDYDIIDGS